MLTIAFDMDDTLYDLESPYREALARCFPGKDLPVDGLFQAQLNHYSEVFEQARSGMLGMDDMFSRRQVLAFADFGITLTGRQAFTFQRTYRNLQSKISLTHTMRYMLDELVGARANIGIVSNGYSSNQWRKFDTLGLGRWFDREKVVISQDVGASKPGRRIFDDAAERLGAQPAEIWFVGDAYDNDVMGASVAGWRTVWFNRRDGKVPSGGVQPDVTVTTEQELRALVRSFIARS